MTESLLRKGTSAGEPRKFYFESEVSMEGIEEATDPGDRSKHFLDCKGKRVGPFLQSLLASVLPDKSRFIALGVRDKATAYNAGYKRGAAQIRKEEAIPRFHTGLILTKPVYSYAAISTDFYRKR